MPSIDIQITYDFICPWCWIGHQHLLAALARVPDIPVTMHYQAYELNPTMPKEGTDRRAYRIAKFGSWARSQALDADVSLAGQRAGIEFHYDLVVITPNTRLAHRLMVFADNQGDPAKNQALFEGVFRAYFSEGRDIGKVDVLASLAAQAGFDSQAARDYLSTSAGEREVVAAQFQAQAVGVHSVPSVLIGNKLISGAQPASALVQALQKVAAQGTVETTV